MLKSSLFDYSNAYVHVKRFITVNNTAAAGAYANNTNKKVQKLCSIHFCN